MAFEAFSPQRFCEALLNDTYFAFGGDRDLTNWPLLPL
jgi:hypothetical protein